MNKSHAAENFRTIFIYFLIYSMIGYLYEIGVYFFELHQGFVNRGFLWGPYIPVYGFGALVVLASTAHLKSKKIMISKINITPVICFFAIMLLTTAVELAASYIMQWCTGGWLWDYTADGPNFQGRIALKSSIRFAVIGILGLYILQPLLTKMNESLKRNKIYIIITYVVLILFGTDAIIHIVKLF